MDLNALLASPPAFPSLPRAVALLMAELAQDEPNLRRVNQFFATDPALAARLLCLANSDEFGAPRRVAGVPEALALADTGQLADVRAGQARAWLWDELRAGLTERFRTNPKVAADLATLEDAVTAGEMAPTAATQILLDRFTS